jgi:DoxX-like family
MTQHARKCTILALRLTVGIVVMIESGLFAFGASAAHVFAKTGLPHWIRPALGIPEIVAALLFLLPATSLVGGYALLMIFLFAVAIHILHGWYDVGGLLVYAAAVLACIRPPGHHTLGGRP